MLNPPYPGIPQRTNTNEVFERVFDKVMTDTYGFAPERNEDGTLDEEEAVDREIRLAQLIPPPKPKKEPTYTKQGTPLLPKMGRRMDRTSRKNRRRTRTPLLRRTHQRNLPLRTRSLQELQEKPYPMHAQLISLRENLHMLQIMITRAANALSITQLTTETVQETEKYYAKHEKPSALLQAHQMLTREHRLTLSLYNTFIKQWGVPRYEVAY